MRLGLNLWLDPCLRRGLLALLPVLPPWLIAVGRVNTALPAIFTTRTPAAVTTRHPVFALIFLSNGNTLDDGLSLFSSSDRGLNLLRQRGGKHRTC